MAQTDEVAALLSETRTLVGQAHVLAGEIDSTLAELLAFTRDLHRFPFPDRRQSQSPYQGEDRRA